MGKKLLALCAMLGMVFAMGLVVYAASARVAVESLTVGMVLEDVEIFTTGGNTMHLEGDGLQTGWHVTSYTVSERLKVISVSHDSNHSGGDCYTVVFEAITNPVTNGSEDDSSNTNNDNSNTNNDNSNTNKEDKEDSKHRKELEKQRKEEEWRKSNANPDNYLPKVTGADGKEIQSTIPSHYTDNRKNSSIQAVLSTTPEQELAAALGIRTGGYAHMNAFASQCGPSLWAMFEAYANAIHAMLSKDITIGDVFELQMEVRDKDTYELLDTVKESSVPVNLVVALKGDVLDQVKNGADCAVLCYADGEITLIKDTDNDPSTITMSTTKTSGIFAVVYAPAGTFDALP